MELSDLKVVAEGLSFPEGPVAISDGSVTAWLWRGEPSRRMCFASRAATGPKPAPVRPRRHRRL